MELNFILVSSFAIKRPVPALFPPGHLICGYMTPEGIVNLTAVFSISFAFLQPMAVEDQEARVLQFDQMITGCRSILRRCGRPAYLNSIWVLWYQLSQALHALERVLWPGLPAETPLNIDLPAEARPMSDLLLDEFDNAAPSISPALTALDAFHTWFRAQYDPALHHDLDQTLTDAALVFRSVEGMLLLKQRCRALQAAQATAAATTPSASTTPAAEAAAPAFPISSHHPTSGEDLTWY